jgi:Uma2 family endonuclease
MNALPLQPGPRTLLTVADYVALPEDTSGTRFELVEGTLVMSPRPTTAHQLCIYEVQRQLHHQVPASLRAVAEVDVDLELVPSTQPGFVRVPDVVVVPREVLDRQREEGGLIRAREVVLAVEVISPGSRRLDTVVKHGEYADAGIPHYWVVDLGERGDRIQLTAHHLAGEFGSVGRSRADAGPVSGTFTATEPFPVRLDLDALV